MFGWKICLNLEKKLCTKVSLEYQHTTPFIEIETIKSLILPQLFWKIYCILSYKVQDDSKQI